MGWLGMESTTFILLLLWMVTVSGQTPCSPIDFITNQQLPSVTIYEADSSFLLNSFKVSNPERYTAQIRIQGTVGQNVQVTLSQGSAPINPLLYFSIQPSDVNNQNNGVYITLSSPLDRDAQNYGRFDFRLTCTYLGTPTEYTLPVVLADLNDNSPVFTNTPYTDNVNEISAVNTALSVQVTATDADSGQNQNIQFAVVFQELTGLNNNFHRTTNLDFAISSQVENGRTVGTLRVARDLDYEKLAANGSTTYRLNITATDQSINMNARRTSFISYIVNIEDGDGQVPEFFYSSCRRLAGSNYCYDPRYTTTILSNFPTGKLTLLPIPPVVPIQQVVTIQAKVRDILNATITFDILKSDPEGYHDRFTVTTTAPQPGNSFYTASIFQTQAIQRSAVLTRLDLVLQARRVASQNYFSNAIITVNIIDITNNSDPVITGNSGSIIHVRSLAWYAFYMLFLEWFRLLNGSH